MTDKAVKAAASLSLLSHYDDLPPWMQLDAYIKHGYRRQLHTIGHCFSSLFYQHNELVNAWSHLLPAFAYLYILLRADYTFLTLDNGSNIGVKTGEQLMVYLYVASSATCLLWSVRSQFSANKSNSDRITGSTPENDRS